MDARTYLNQHGENGAKALVEAVTAAGRNCTLGYFKQIAYGYRRPSVELAEALVEHDPQRALDFVSLMKAKKPAGSAPDGTGDSGSHAPQ